MKQVLKRNGLKTQTDEAVELGRSQGNLAYITTFEMLNEDIIHSCLYFNALFHPSKC